ncbi:hypothetical protein CRG98_046847 [Punica granatum]|uniref:Uncharacterized protein n=1 Tax=Punica granatum TaxID=22663 RepID=A0A2I0HM07_PUNGR|nr:hypothetical protein CRG98_046847 [Punica granatum]
MGLQEAPGGLLMRGRKERKGGGARLNGSRHATTLSRGRVRVVRNPYEVMARLAMVVGRNGVPRIPGWP